MVTKDSASGFGIGLLAGAAIGLVVGILYAPRSGKDTREQVGEKAHEVVETAKEKVAGIKHAVGERLA